MKLKHIAMALTDYLDDIWGHFDGNKDCGTSEKGVGVNINISVQPIWIETIPVINV